MSVLAGIERRHLPRGRLYAAIPLPIENGSPILPEIVLWTLALDEGDLLTVSPDLMPGSFRFQSYLAELESILTSMGDPWTYVEPMLRRPMAAVGPRGALLLPEQAAALVEQQGGALVLRADWKNHRCSDNFVLRVEKRPPSSPQVRLEKEYTLPILSGSRVILPEEALWLTGLRGGGRLACKTYLGEARFEPAERAGHLGERFWVELEPDGTLTLPETLCKLAEESFYDQVELRVNSPRFEIALRDDWEGEEGLARALRRVGKER